MLDALGRGFRRLLTPPSPDSVHGDAASVQRAAAYLKERLPTTPALGVVLGSGLGAWAQRLDQRRAIPYSEIPGMPAPTVAGHAGRLWVGRMGDVKVACLEGRVHSYEGHAVARTVFGVRLLAELGCKGVLLTNAAGGIRAELVPGSLMVITDHLNLTGRNPLVGWFADGHPRFIDMTHAYDARLVAAARSAAEAIGLPLAQGVYAALLGPSYETPAEIRMLRTLGADAVGMSTALEAIALRERGVAVGAVSCITNCAAGLSSAALDHDDVQATAQKSRAHFEGLLDAWVQHAAVALS